MAAYGGFSGQESHWKIVESDLSEFAYTEKMVYLIMNTDETFELRYVDYYTISGFDLIMNLEAGSQPPETQNGTAPTKRLGKKGDDQEMTAKTKDDLIVEDKIQQILQEKRKKERNINVCIYGRHEFIADREIKFTATHVYHNLQASESNPAFSVDDLIDQEGIRNTFAGEIEHQLVNSNAVYKISLALPFKIDKKFKSLTYQVQGGSGRID